MDFIGFPKISRLFRDIVVTEKIDGTNGCIAIGDGGEFYVGSRSRWITRETDNHGFAHWAYDHEDELRTLGSGRHFGEWWGQGINRGYGLKEKRFSLFNVARWGDPDNKEGLRPACCHVVPVLYRGPFDLGAVRDVLEKLKQEGSAAAPGYMNAEGVMVYHTKGNVLFKATIHGDDESKQWSSHATVQGYTILEGSSGSTEGLALTTANDDGSHWKEGPENPAPESAA